jgi:hypothetical protein
MRHRRIGTMRKDHLVWIMNSCQDKHLHEVQRILIRMTAAVLREIDTEIDPVGLREKEIVIIEHEKKGRLMEPRQMNDSFEELQRFHQSILTSILREHQIEFVQTGDEEGRTNVREAASVATNRSTTERGSGEGLALRIFARCTERFGWRKSSQPNVDQWIHYRTSIGQQHTFLRMSLIPSSQ